MGPFWDKVNVMLRSAASFAMVYKCGDLVGDAELVK